MGEGDPLVECQYCLATAILEPNLHGLNDPHETAVQHLKIDTTNTSRISHVSQPSDKTPHRQKLRF